MSGLDLLNRNVSGMDAAPFVPTTFGEVTAANTYSFSLQQPLGIPKLAFQAEEAKEFSGRNDLIKKRFQVDDPFQLIDTADLEAKYPNPTPDGRIRLLNEKQARLDEFIEKQRQAEPEKWQGIKTKKEIERPLRQEARFAARTSQEVSSRADPISAMAGTLIGGFGGAMTDAVNLTTLPLGFGSSMGILKTMAAEGALNAAIEASQVKGRSEWMNELGMKYGVKEAALDIAFAGAGSAALIGTVRGGGALYRSFAQRGSKGVEVLSQVADDLSLPIETRDALKYQSRVAHIDEENPVINPTREEVAAHRQNLDETQKAVREYREPVYAEEMSPRRSEQMKAPVSWVIKNKETDEIIFETFDKAKVDALNTAKYKAVPILEHLEGLNKKSNAPSLENLETKAKAKNVSISVSETGKEINLSKIVVPKDERNKGVGTELMNDLIKYADQAGKRITLSPSSDFGGAKTKLTPFYKRFGFVENKGKNKDFSTKETMYREPQEVRSQTTDPMLTPETTPLETMRTSTEAMEEAIPAFEADFARLLKDKPDMEIDMDGTTVRLADIADEIKENTNILNAIRTCATG